MEDQPCPSNSELRFEKFLCNLEIHKERIRLKSKFPVPDSMCGRMWLTYIWYSTTSALIQVFLLAALYLAAFPTRKELSSLNNWNYWESFWRDWNKTVLSYFTLIFWFALFHFYSCLLLKTTGTTRVLTVQREIVKCLLNEQSTLLLSHSERPHRSQKTVLPQLPHLQQVKCFCQCQQEDSLGRMTFRSLRGSAGRKLGENVDRFCPCKEMRTISLLNFKGKEMGKACTDYLRCLHSELLAPTDCFWWQEI